ncbi:TPA: hypothetical protein HA241_04340 [Candidatus Woesearchaeota archaeon]|nr:hypothetical protein [Candidatus Woesearchaeota archaeon]
MISQPNLTQALYFIQDRLCDSRRYSLTGTGHHGFSVIDATTATPFVVTIVNALATSSSFGRHYVRNKDRGMWTVPIFYADGRTALRSIQNAYPGWTSDYALAPCCHKADSLIALSEQELEVLDISQKYLSPAEARLTYFCPETEIARPHLELISFTPIHSAPLPYQLGCIEDDVFPTESIVLRHGDLHSLIAQVQLKQEHRAAIAQFSSAFHRVHLS